ncbi:hypothetical protein P154DRAFT_617399 [Amniculicola lignicola CBS 123094]|uniref:Zn(2)-C6 fungal-type domain-containing protein n=1 Tax=Amniculicola lignicola CBS 123094 TaxID=1392246 RepID=A0A6A5WSY6_9PLEO|nr:hypothetical protein P154DRAFT_617399 [Amniculicola lignicola CBS 123094]
MESSFTVSTVAAASKDDNHKRQCWECLRRRLVCDFARPGCKKCQTHGAECPGYGEKKPLKWLAPGKVKSRTRKQALVKRTPHTSHDLEKCTVALTAITINELKAAEEMMEGWEGWADVEFVPRNELRSDLLDVVQAVYYFNEYIYPEAKDINELAQNPFVTNFPVQLLHLMPPSIHHSVVCYILGYRIHHTLGDANQVMVRDQYSRMYHHRGRAIRSLTEELNEEKSRMSDATLASIVLFLCSELQQQAQLHNWRYHLDGLGKLVSMRGGYMKLASSPRPEMNVILAFFMIIGVYANTTSPPTDQITLLPHTDMMHLMNGFYQKNVFPNTLCAPALFTSTIKINDLRARLAAIPVLDDSYRQEAENILEELEGFSPEEWVAASDTKAPNEWILISTIHQSAVMIFCISSFQCLSLLPQSKAMESKRTFHGDRLILSLTKGVAKRNVERFIMWPLVVAGMEAGNRSAAMRTWVHNSLRDMSKHLGSSSPLLARDVLMKFWDNAAEKKGWDDCFDRPLAFMI